MISVGDGDGKLVIGTEAWHAAVHGVTKNWTWLSNWTELNWPHDWPYPEASLPSGENLAKALPWLLGYTWGQ